MKRSYNNPTIDWAFISKHVKGAEAAWRRDMKIPDEEIRGGITGKPPRAVAMDLDFWSRPADEARAWQYDPESDRWVQTLPRKNEASHA